MAEAVGLIKRAEVRRRRAQLIATLRAVLRSRAFSAPAPALAALVDTVRADLGRGRPGEYVLVWAARHRLAPELAVIELLADPPAPLTRIDIGSSRVGLDAIEPDVARRILEHTIRFDLAYTQPIADEEQATATARRIISALDEPRYWTNGDVGLPGRTGSWGPMTARTFDTGIVAADAEHVLVVWMMDED